MKTYSFFLTLAVFLTQMNVFAQKSVDYYIQQAKDNSPLIHEKKNLDSVNVLEIERLKAVYLKPKVSANVIYFAYPVISHDNNRTKLVFNPVNPTNYRGYGMAVANGGQYQATLNLTQPLFNKKNYKTYAEQLNIASKTNTYATKLSEHDLEKAVTDQFILCTIDKSQIAYTKGIVTLLNHQKEILTKLTASGIYKKSDIILLNITLQGYSVQLSNFNSNYQKDLLDLNILCGINNDDIVDIKNINIQPKEEEASTFFMSKFKLDSLSVINLQKQFELKYKPQINFYANTGLNTAYAPSIPHRIGVGFGLSLTYNLWDGNQKRITRSKTKLMAESITNYKHNFVSSNNIRKSKIKKQLDAYSEQILITENQLKDYNSLINSYKKEMISGQLSVVSYIAVLKNKATAQLNYTLLFSQKQLLINAYNYWNW